MMKRIALLTAVVGASSLAAGCEAQVQTRPAYATTGTRREPPPPPPRQYEPAPPPAPAPPPPPRHDHDRAWVSLAESYSADSDRQFINLVGRGGEFRKIKIESVRGTPMITRVAIEYMNKEMQVVDLNQRFARGENHVIDLNGRGREINRIIVYTDPRAGGKYSVFGT